ncbi:MAG: helix-turn-helix domain-containing protein [Lachnospiraceae bacterium]|jgi:AraC-like DNA-binding protein
MNTDKLFCHLDRDILTYHVYSIDSNMQFHVHDGYEIYIFLDGNANYYIEHSMYRLKRGSILVIRPGEYHRVALIDTNRYERVICNFTTKYFDTLSSDRTNLGACFWDRPAGEQNMALVNEQDLVELLQMINCMGMANNSPLYGQDLIAKSFALQILVKVNQIYRSQIRNEAVQGNAMPPLITRILMYIDEHLTEKITLDDLEAQFYLNGAHLSRKFKKVMGVTISHYIVSKRIERAEQLIREGKNLTDICMESGFNNYSNFARTFTQMMGCSPKSYQMKLLSGQPGSESRARSGTRSRRESGGENGTGSGDADGSGGAGGTRSNNGTDIGDEDD